MTEDELAQGFRPLPIEAWRLFCGDSLRPIWQMIDGALSRVSGDLVTHETFENFDLRLEWKVEPGANSGIMYRVTEELDSPWKTGPEMQVLDDERHDDGKNRLTAAGANYGLYEAPPGAVRPAGSWNEARIVVNGAHVEHWLNGVKVAEYELWSSDWERRVAASKFREWPQFGRARRGHIALQDHNDRVAFRNIRIRELP